jgi:uncharacterized protein with NRDE domain
VSGYLTTSADPEAYLDQFERDAALYDGFNLLVGDARRVFYYSNRESERRRLGPGIYGLSNHLLDTAWPKVTTSKHALGASHWASATARW